jgi:hypothetical protein
MKSLDHPQSLSLAITFDVSDEDSAYADPHEIPGDFMAHLTIGIQGPSMIKPMRGNVQID